METADAEDEFSTDLEWIAFKHNSSMIFMDGGFDKKGAELEVVVDPSSKSTQNNI